MIEVENLSKLFHTPSGPVRALEDVTLKVNKGEIFGIIGQSGAGKSTLIRCINLLEKPTSGSIIIDGAKLNDFNPKELRLQRQKIGMIFQHFNLLASKTVYQNIAFPLVLTKHSRLEIEKIIAPLLELTGLEDKKNHYPSQLSGGQRQKVAIARALANKPVVLLCDEATSALDPVTTASILKLLKDINEKLNLTIVLITHEMSVIKEICDQVAVLEQGTLVEQADIIQLFTNPQTETTKALVKTTLQLDLPKEIQDVLHIEKAEGKIPLLRIEFLGEKTAEPLITQMITRFQIDLNFLQANMKLIHGEIMGIMLVEAIGKEEKIKASIEYLTSKGLKVEIIGYVASNHTTSI